MKRLSYLWSKLLKKARLAAIVDSEVHATSKVEPGTSFVSSSMGRHSFCGYDCDVAHAEIGSFVSIANGVVLGGGRHPMEWVGMSPVFYSGRDSVKAKFSEHDRPPPEKVKVGHDVWIGRNAIVLPGVSIGHGAVIGAGAVVTRDIPPYGVAAGCPAKLVRHRFDEETIHHLLASMWWDFPDEKLMRFAAYFKDPQEFINRLGDDKSDND
ncbi:CatB-related O-acetyltransferase [Parerythrobacter jejuensis]|uniref:Antibiotic acetyltransferase n=1 Tax=Parerythrobacter jejuensis TaxID=795812 RepID=A0A845AY04_9SPHN|nr:CatB-related O-acetyltransferase [Parerythrobacter jejuensis]MXP30881.1 antibiotic acetyltransferase [Parerythrobacter jejuensis]MXP33641.1 antibiotic acetyltransferase [Parerythrobacter jejuensis]